MRGRESGKLKYAYLCLRDGFMREQLRSRCLQLGIQEELFRARERMVRLGEAAGSDTEAVVCVCEQRAGHVMSCRATTCLPNSALANLDQRPHWHSDHTLL